MKKALIIIIEDEEDILELVEYTLQKEGYDTIGFLNDQKLFQVLEEEDVNLIIMDRNLPSSEGAMCVKELREKGYDTPVIFLTAKDSPKDIIDGFEMGGDDYITKPFDINEFVARVKALLKRTQKNYDDNLRMRDIVYIAHAKEIYIDDKKLNLTKLELSLLVEFMKNKNILLTREYLLNTVWGYSQEKKEKSVNVAVKRLKEKIDPDKDKDYIKSIRGEGYIFG
ncbi:MAG: chemotaxis protein CheY [Sulfurovum sp. PC08-66]|jgi:DNA-binding response OmpR family regulator|nr:MAG: chemotaxis protein CheY [Sulfurovum sp. PC08-66]